jgi:hypothetical protein
VNAPRIFEKGIGDNFYGSPLPPKDTATVAKVMEGGKISGAAQSAKRSSQNLNK